MATVKPRITVTLTQRQYDVLKVISDCGGNPMSAFITEMLEVSLPTLERMAATFQQIKYAQDKQKTKFAEVLNEAQVALEPIAMSALDQFDLFLGNVAEAAAPGVRGTSAAGAVAHALAPATNRGATPPRPKARKPSAGKALQSVSGSLKKSKKGA